MSNDERIVYENRIVDRLDTITSLRDKVCGWSPRVFHIDGSESCGAIDAMIRDQREAQEQWKDGLAKLDGKIATAGNELRNARDAIGWQAMQLYKQTEVLVEDAMRSARGLEQKYL
jgi:hypothetical protein